MMSANPELTVQSTNAPVVKPSHRVAPASFFGMPLGILALGLLWRSAAEAWAVVPRTVGESLIAVGAPVWCVVAGFWVAKWFYARREAAAELEHPVQCCFVGLAGVTALLIGIGATPYLKIVGMVFGFLGGAWVAGVFAVADWAAVDGRTRP
jgi:tellurite resistance protein